MKEHFITRERWGTRNTEPYSSVSPNSGRRFLWGCEFGHEYSRVFRKQKPNSKCPICTGSLVIPEMNSISVTNPEVAEFLVLQKDAEKYSMRSRKKLQFLCRKCFKEFLSTPQNFASNGICRDCGFSFPRGTTIWAAFPQLKDLFSGDPESVNELPYGSSRYLDWVCEEGHVFSERAYKLAARKNICTICSATTLRKGVNDLITVQSDFLSFWRDPRDRSSFTEGSQTVVSWECAAGHRFERSIVGHKRAGGSCPKCLNTKISSEEKELFDWLSERYSVERLKLGRKEIDCYLPDYSIGIEFNEIYWYLEEVVFKNEGISAKEKHLKKISNMC